MKQILVSACLLGQHVRYDGTKRHFINSLLKTWHSNRAIVLFCPEVAGGLSIPRPASEISNGEGKTVLSGLAKVINIEHFDVTKYFIKGAQKALQIAIANNIELAILKDGSPSCGSTYIYDGSFSGKQTSGTGVTTSLLESNNIRVFNEHQIIEAEAFSLSLL